MALVTNNSHEQRGVIAIIAGVALFFVVALGLGITELGFNAVHSFEAHNASEAVAMTGGMVVLSQPSPWDIAQVPASYVVPGNSRSTENFEVFSFVPLQDSPNSGPTSPINAPGISASEVSGPLQNFGTMLTQPATVGGYSSSAVYQYQLNNIVPVLARIVLVLDYSKSMRLYFSGYDANSGAALNVLRTAAHDAITAPALNNPPRVNWGLVTFAGQPDPNPVPPTNVYRGAPQMSQAQINAKQSNLETHLLYGTGAGMTDMQAAVASAYQLLKAQDDAHPNDPYIGKGIILIVTDGEPDYVPGQTDDSVAGYALRVQAAEDNVRNYVRGTVWPAGYQTMALTVLTDPGGIPPASLTAFMQSISGNSDRKQNVEPGSAYVATRPSDVTAWVNYINPATHCLSRNQVTVNNAPWMNLPGPADNVYGYYVAGGAPRYQESGTLRSHDPNNMDPAMNAQFQWAPGPDQFWWDAKDQLVEMNVTLCLKYMQQQNMNPPPLFRMRWGTPRVWDTKKL